MQNNWHYYAATHLYMSPAERFAVFDLCGFGSPARLMSEGGKTQNQGRVARIGSMYQFMLCAESVKLTHIWFVALGA